MKKIRMLSYLIEDEIQDAEKYARKALEFKEKDRHLADTFNVLSAEEMKHMNMLHGEVVRIIEEFKQTRGDPPPGMMAMYDVLHDKHIEAAKTVKILQSMYAEQ